MSGANELFGTQVKSEQPGRQADKQNAGLNKPITELITSCGRRAERNYSSELPHKTVVVCNELLTRTDSRL